MPYSSSGSLNNEQKKLIESEIASLLELANSYYSHLKAESEPPPQFGNLQFRGQRDPQEWQPTLRNKKNYVTILRNELQDTTSLDHCRLKNFYSAASNDSMVKAITGHRSSETLRLIADAIIVVLCLVLLGIPMVISYFRKSTPNFRKSHGHAFIDEVHSSEERLEKAGITFFQQGRNMRSEFNDMIPISSINDPGFLV